MNQDKKNYCIIMAGGIGSRFWPMSRSSFPKQFHDVLGLGRSLLQMTYDRHVKICLPGNILVVTNLAYREIVLEQLPELKPEQVLCEPYMRNTAPCVAYASCWIADRETEANIIVAPSDHVIMREEEYIATLLLSLQQSRETKNLVTLGIKPTRPDTGYGYIQWADVGKTPDPRVKKVKTFTEKPNLELAKDFLDSGDFYWNSGIFIWSLATIMQALEKNLPEMFKAFREGAGLYGTPAEAEFIENTYGTCENISIDYGVMEKAKNVNVVLSDFGWSDLGTWGSLHTLVAHDDHRNGVVGQNIMMYQCSNNMVYMSNDKLAVLHGLNGFIVVDSGNALLICKKDEEQKIKQFVNDLKMREGDQWL